MRSFWSLCGLLAFGALARSLGLTFAIVLLTGLSAEASVWFALISGELVNRIAYFHHPTAPTTPSELLTTVATLAASAITGMPVSRRCAFFFSTTLHRRWRHWLDKRFNQARLDTSRTHFHLQQSGLDAVGSAVSPPDNIDQRVRESIEGTTGGAIGLAMGIAGVILSLGFVGSKLIATSSPVRGFRFLGTYGTACLTFLAIAIYVPLNIYIAAKLGGILQHLSMRMQWAEGSYRTELNVLMHRSLHVALLKGEKAQKRINTRRYATSTSIGHLNRVTAGYMGFELVHNFLGSRIVA